MINEKRQFELIENELKVIVHFSKENWGWDCYRIEFYGSIGREWTKMRGIQKRIFDFAQDKIKELHAI